MLVTQDSTDSSTYPPRYNLSPDDFHDNQILETHTASSGMKIFSFRTQPRYNKLQSRSVSLWQLSYIRKYSDKQRDLFTSCS
ncbi:hypothetical protein GDO81_009286 [Engystomops pustulosus]|uniref:Uncharacterized protein n=1 Tax=Engystomops pustulosus TaxID=76066 RepID=A0AAV7BQ92_ENGPU|nr:hypothetical protein GDO81_009286 [Engystomops pustulosus]